MKLPDMLIPGPLKKPQKPGTGNGTGDGADPVERLKEAPADLVGWIDPCGV